MPTFSLIGCKMAGKYAPVLLKTVLIERVEKAREGDARPRKIMLYETMIARSHLLPSGFKITAHRHEIIAGNRIMSSKQFDLNRKFRITLMLSGLLQRRRDYLFAILDITVQRHESRADATSQFLALEVSCGESQLISRACHSSVTEYVGQRRSELQCLKIPAHHFGDLFRGRQVRPFVWHDAAEVAICQPAGHQSPELETSHNGMTVVRGQGKLMSQSEQPCQLQRLVAHRIWIGRIDIRRQPFHQFLPKRLERSGPNKEVTHDLDRGR